MGALEPGRPLSFLDAYIKCGNSLLGATPDLIAAGIPDDAFKRIEGAAPSASVGMDDPDPGSLRRLSPRMVEATRRARLWRTLFVRPDTN